MNKLSRGESAVPKVLQRYNRLYPLSLKACCRPLLPSSSQKLLIPVIQKRDELTCGFGVAFTVGVVVAIAVVEEGVGRVGYAVHFIRAVKVMVVVLRG